MNKVDKLIENVRAMKKKLDEPGACWYVTETGEEKNLAVDFGYACKELAETKSTDALLCLLDFFENEFDIKREGVLEGLETNIENNFSEKQIIEAFYGKFADLLEKNLWRCVDMVESIIYTKELFEKFRKMFNTVKASESNEFLDRFSRLRPKYKSEISLLREDMKKW